MHFLHKTYNILNLCFGRHLFPTAAVLPLFVKTKPLQCGGRRAVMHLHCRVCHSDQRLSGASEERTRGDVKGRIGAKCYGRRRAVTSRERHVPSQFMNWFQMGSGKWEMRERIVSTSYARQAPTSEAISRVAKSPGKAPSRRDFTSPEC